MSAKEIVKPFLTKSIRVCDRCNKLDVKTYARYKLYGDKYILDGAYQRCQRCEHIEELSKDDIKWELKNIELGWLGSDDNE